METRVKRKDQGCTAEQASLWVLNSSAGVLTRSQCGSQASSTSNTWELVRNSV